MAGNLTIQIDFSEVNAGLQKLTNITSEKSNEGLRKVANELLLLSQAEVPLDTGQLLKSGSVKPLEREKAVLVGYNKVYSARLHENPQFNFQNGRKGKYLEDPLKKNLSVFLDYYGKVLQGVFK